MSAASSGRRAEAARCLLGFAGYRPAPEADAVSGVMDAGTARGAATAASLRAFQHSRRLPTTGRVDRATWTALLATGTRPVVKRGSAGPPVRRVQRALNAALPGAIRVSGVFGWQTAARVRSYQARVGLPATGVVAARTWRHLTHGVLHRAHPAHRSQRPHRGHRAHRGHRGHRGHRAHRAHRAGHHHARRSGHHHAHGHGHGHVRKHHAERLGHHALRHVAGHGRHAGHRVHKAKRQLRPHRVRLHLLRELDLRR